MSYSWSVANARENGSIRVRKTGEEDNYSVNDDQRLQVCCVRGLPHVEFVA